MYFARNKTDRMKKTKLTAVYSDEDHSADQFEQFEHHSCSGSSVQLFLARRKGRGHIAKVQPCQDYGLYGEMEYGVILTAADGLGSCEFSDKGSRFACESAVSVIREIASEEQNELNFIRKMGKLFTRRRIISEWLYRIKTDLMERDAFEGEKLYQASEEYNSTLMYAVITDHYMLGGSIGDGQILFFNDKTAYRLRPYVKKDSSMTDSLHDPRSWLEGFHTAVFERGLFSGVLLSTDGIYDFLSEGRSFHLYAKQLCDRFLASGRPEFPFDYVTDDGKIHHLYQSGTFDDCTIHLALCLQPLKKDPVQEYVNEHTDRNVIDRMTSLVRKYSALKGQKRFTVISSRIPAVFHTGRADVIGSIQEQDKDGIHYSFYPETEFTSIEQMFTANELNMNRSNDVKHLLRIPKVYEQLKRLADDLAEQNLKLNDAAGFLCGYDAENHLILYKEAVSNMKSSDIRERYSGFEKYFRNMSGALIFENRKYPLFRCGMSEVSNLIMRFDGLGTSELGEIKRVCRKDVLLNRSGMNWIDQDGNVIHPGEPLALKAGASFSFQARNDIRLTYHFIKKENL